MNSTLKIFLVIALFSSITLADDGNMGNGGFTDGNMGNGGRTYNADQTTKTGNDNQTDSFLEYIQNYLAKIFG